MSFVKFLSAAIALFAFGQMLADAVPMGSPSLAPRDVPCDDISKYTTQVSQDLYIF